MFADEIFNILNIIYIIKDEAESIIRTNNIEEYKRIKDLDINNNLLYDEANKKWYEFKTFSYEENNNKYIIEIYKDVTKYKQDNINKLDFTTKLLNKYFAFKQLDEYLINANKNMESFTIAMADIDFFKNINDTYGHLAGDEILKKVGKCLIENTKDNDIIGRFGGEEFIIVLKNTNLEDSKKLLEKIRKDINDLIVNYNDNIIDNVTISIGAIYCDSISYGKLDQNCLKNIQIELIEKADQALYYIKENGRNQVEFYNNI